MKITKVKKIVSLFVAVCLLVTAIVLPSFAQTKTNTFRGHTVYATSSFVTRGATAATYCNDRFSPVPTFTVSATLYYSEAVEGAPTLTMSDSAQNASTTFSASVGLYPGSQYSYLRITASHKVTSEGETWSVTTGEYK